MKEPSAGKCHSDGFELLVAQMCPFLIRGGLRVNRNELDAVIDLYKNYCDFTAETRPFFSLHSHNDTIRDFLQYFDETYNNSIANCRRDDGLKFQILNTFHQLLEEHLKTNNKYLNPNGTIVSCISTTQTILRERHANEKLYYIGLTDLCFYLSKEQIQERALPEPPTSFFSCVSTNSQRTESQNGSSKNERTEQTSYKCRIM